MAASWQQCALTNTLPKAPSAPTLSAMGNFTLGRWFGLLITCLVLSACSGDQENGPSCGTFNACGGDIVGTWEWQTSCGDATPSSSACESTLTPEMLVASNTVIISADGTINATMVSADVDYTATYNAACFSTITGQPKTDADVVQLCNDMNAVSDTNLTASCAMEGTSCVCSYQSRSQTRSTTSTFTTSGNTILSTDAEGNASTNSYCVSGSTLTLSLSTANAFAIYEKH